MLITLGISCRSSPSPAQSRACRGKQPSGTPQGRAKTACGSPKHAARTLIRHSDRRTMRTTQATDLHPRRIPEVSHETKNATRLHTYTMMMMMTPAHTQSWPSHFPAPIGPRTHEPRPPWPGWFTRAAVTPGHGGSRQTPRPWSISPSPRARRQRRRPLSPAPSNTPPFTRQPSIQGTWSHVSPVAGRVPNRPRVVGPAPCMMQPSRTSLVCASLRDSCPPVWRGCNRYLLCETMVLSVAWSMPRVSRRCHGFEQWVGDMRACYFCPHDGRAFFWDKYESRKQARVWNIIATVPSHACSDKRFPILSVLELWVDADLMVLTSVIVL